MTTTPDDVLRFWFEENGPEQWFAKDEAFDDEIRRRFGDALHQAREGKFERWVENARPCLALVILIDQFSRNLFRDSPLAWSADQHALALTNLALEKHFEDSLTGAEKVFLYLPLMHSEQLIDQDRCVELFEAMLEDGDDAFRLNHDYAIRHRDIIARFGRFPHRNEILGRESTPEEIELLKDPNASF